MKPETIFKIKVAAIFKKIPCLWFVKVQQMAINATPDFLCCHKGHFIAIELKKDEYEKPKPLQKYELDKISECMGTSIVMHPKNYKRVIKEVFDYE